MKSLVLTLTFLIGLAFTAIAQPPAMQSRIVDLSGNGIADVEIVGVSRCLPIAFPAQNSTKSTVSDASGWFTLPDPWIPSAAGSACMHQGRK